MIVSLCTASVDEPSRHLNWIFKMFSHCGMPANPSNSYKNIHCRTKWSQAMLMAAIRQNQDSTFHCLF